MVTELAAEGWQQALSDELTRFSPAECVLSPDSYNDATLLRVLNMQKGMNISPLSFVG